ncbi:MAG: hypothetical protein A2144_14150 [Chloroflexi bacterium RBG_16_50_9]|nr:MAG: hypothetical protein A2144_14150 [Chloroflexi bacterium RBG_16_50_9]
MMTGENKGTENVLITSASALKSFLAHFTYKNIPDTKTSRTPEKIKVFISDPKALFRDGLHFIISREEDLEVTGKSTSNEEAFALIELNPPNVAILSMIDSKFNGPEITCRIKINLPSVSVILTMDENNDEQVFAAIKSGASACLTKDTKPEFLLSTIRLVALGGQPIIKALLIPELALRILIEFEDFAVLSDQLNHVLAHLTRNEAEVLNCIRRSKGIRQVAAGLKTDEETIQRYLEMILTKLVANDRARAAIEATQQSLFAMKARTVKSSKIPADYVTREEFIKFEESLMERLKSLTGKSA